MTAHYDKFGAKFLYPENWSINDEQLDEWPRSVSVQSPGSAFWQLNVYPERTNPILLCNEVVEVLRQEYEGLEQFAIDEEIEGHALIGYDLNFYCLDLLVTARVRGFYSGTQTYLIVGQAESREYDEQTLVFDAMTRSLLMESDPAV